MSYLPLQISSIPAIKDLYTYKGEIQLQLEESSEKLSYKVDLN